MKLIITRQKRNFLLCLPLIVLPFLCLVFHVLGGGRGNTNTGSKAVGGLNTQLPASPFDPAKAFQDKLKAYQQAESDSARKAQYQQQDPYRRDSSTAVPPIAPPTPTPLTPPPSRPATPIRPTTPPPTRDTRADELLQQLASLRQSLHQHSAPSRPNPLSAVAREPSAGDAARDEAPDPQIDRLNAMLDKVIRIQHPQEQQPHEAVATPTTHATDEILPADSNANSIAAIVPEDQTLTAGTTITLRIVDSLQLNGRLIPAGQLVYGTVTLSNDRLLVHITSFRETRSLYTTDWQVYDLDGLPGIHIPGMLGRDVAKQSADQGVNSLNLMTLDESLGAQAAGAGIRAAKTFLGRKVRQVRVTVKAGYQLLLRSSNPTHPPKKPTPFQRPTADSSRRPPDPDPITPAPTTIMAHARNQGVQLLIRQICIRDSCLWFGLEWRNHSPIPFTPAYARWYIRDRHAWKRTARQEQTLDPLVTALPAAVGKNTGPHTWTGFPPFALPGDKQLVLEIGEKDGARSLTLIIHPNQILKASVYDTVSKE